MRWLAFRRLDRGGRVVAVQAEPEEDGTAATACAACPKRHAYRVFAWDAAGDGFREIARIPSTGELHRDGGFPEGDVPYIECQLELLSGEP